MGAEFSGTEVNAVDSCPFGWLRRRKERICTGMLVAAEGWVLRTRRSLWHCKLKEKR